MCFGRGPRAGARLRPISIPTPAAVIDSIRRGTAEFVGTFALIFVG
jgi:hypothetical protein